MTEEKNETISVLEEARQIRDEIRAANKERRELLERQENLQAEQMISGNSNAGQQPPKKEEESNTAYADKVMAGESE